MKDTYIFLTYLPIHIYIKLYRYFMVFSFDFNLTSFMCNEQIE